MGFAGGPPEYVTRQQKRGHQGLKAMLTKDTRFPFPGTASRPITVLIDQILNVFLTDHGFRILNSGVGDFQ